MLDFPSRLRNLRIKKSLTQKAMAEYLQITETGYQYYEHGKCETNFATLVKLANYFKVSVDYLLGLTDNPERNL